MLQANWIIPGRDFGEVCPLFLREFSVEKPIVGATLRATARGVYEATLNGTRVGDFVMAPGWTAYEHRIQVQSYDVTSLLQRENKLIIRLANGWFGKGVWRDKDKVHPEPCSIIAELTIRYIDGTTEVIGTDENWRVAESELRYCDLYNGVIYDARVQPTFDHHAAVSEYNDQTVLCEQIGEKITEQERLSVKEIITTPNGETVIDFGQNLTGYVEISLTAKAGERVSLSFAEILDRDGNFYNENYRSAKALYDYTCKDGEQTFKPGMTFYGFRYVRVDEFPGTVKLENFTAVAVHSDMRRTGYIETSDPMLNQLFHNIIWGQKGNFLDVPTDCPQRNERLGWTGDAQVFMRTATYNYDVRKFFRKWLLDMKSQQGEDGSIPGVIPNVLTRRISAAWGDAVTICSWQYYLTYGDKAILEEMFEPMTKWVDYITATTEKENLWFGGDHYGDWLELKCAYGERKGETRDDLVASAFYAYSTEIVVKAGRVLGRDVSKYEALYQRIVSAFQAEFEGTFKTQTEHILPLYFGLCRDRAAVAKSLADMVHADGDKLQTGFVGTPYLLHVLSDNGYSDLAYQLLLRREYPSWLYPITKGATTIWEHWDGIKPDGDIWPASMNSFNHYAYGSVADFLYGVCAGIRTVEEAPGFARVCFAPVPTDEIEWFSAEIETAHGPVRSAWRHQDGRVVYELTTPVPATAVIAGKRLELEAGTHLLEG